MLVLCSLEVIVPASLHPIIQPVVFNSRSGHKTFSFSTFTPDLEQTEAGLTLPHPQFLSSLSFCSCVLLQPTPVSCCHYFSSPDQFWCIYSFRPHSSAFHVLSASPLFPFVISSYLPAFLFCVFINKIIFIQVLVKVIIFGSYLPQTLTKYVGLTTHLILIKK